jgi:uncharacterized protein DUF3179
MDSLKILLMLLLMTVIIAAYGQRKNGFDLRNSEINTDLIKQGGPPKDGIPALTNPDFLSANKVNYLQNKDAVIGVSVNGEHRAYPLKIMNYHEIVNDEVGGEAIVISYCPLCGSALVFSAMFDKQKLEFGVSGLLYNSDVLMYDKQTNSLWSQLMMQAITGQMQGEKLSFITAEQTTWGSWQAQHPTTRVLSDKTGYTRDYKRNPYAGYSTTPTLYFPVTQYSEVLPAKERVLGVEVDGKFKAYPYSALAKTGKTFIDRFNGVDYTINFDADNKSAKIEDASKPLIYLTTFWFAWYAFHPATEIYKASNK